MINTTPDKVIFNQSDRVLSDAVATALKSAAMLTLEAHKLEHINLENVTTKTNLTAAFAKFVYGRILKTNNIKFNIAYVDCAFRAYRQKAGHINREDFDLLMAADLDGMYSYKKSYAASIKTGLGLFLLALHSSGAITLPATFYWPSMRKDGPIGKQRLEVGKLISSELLSFIRTLDSQSNKLPHPAFRAIKGDKKRLEWFLTYGTKLLLALGWHRPEDANIEDLLKIKKAEKSISGNDEMPLAYSTLLDVLNLAFPGFVPITSQDWAIALNASLENSGRQYGRKHEAAKNLEKLLRDGPRSEYDLLDEITSITASWGYPRNIKLVERLPGLNVEIHGISKLWLALEELYIQKISRESYKQVYTALGWWNVYLFFYLSYWFFRNRITTLVFPTSPKLLIKSIFISRLLEPNQELPATYIEFINSQAKHKEWAKTNIYAIILQLQAFFEFIESYCNEFPGCKGFTQPLTSLDYPKLSRPTASKKQPVPRRFFGVYLDYHEALIAHQSVVIQKVVDGSLTSEDIKNLESNGNVIDTFATSSLVGFVPMIFTKTKSLPLQFIPNVLNTRYRTIKGSKSVLLPHPHTLLQNLVALHTGIRHNHIQWLDRDKFDSFVQDDDNEFTLLYVNTDKQKTEAWTPSVNIRVIELLRAQLEWLEITEEPGFQDKHYYNGNPKTKWPKFKPLFSYASDGKPHTDDKYTETWKAVLCGLQGLMRDLPEFGRVRELVRLLPPGIFPNDPNLSKALHEYGSKFKMGEYCPLRATGQITPHSARVSVVSQYITFLPTDLIGKYITGQKPGVVAYYVHLDKESIEKEQVHQAAHMRATALRNAFEPVLSGGSTSTTFIHADKVNSNLARSMKLNLNETIISYGGMSISFNESSNRGIDILRETGAADVAFNKTEVCPYGNTCPTDIIKELNGIRRCSLCPYAVRFIDHLPALVAKKRQVAETIDEVEKLLAMDAKTLNAKYSPEELDIIEEERSRLCEDLSGWTLSEEILEVMRQRIAAGHDTRTWTVQKPEIIEQDLRRFEIQTNASEYLLARLGESISFPMLESPQVRARFDLLRRELLARSGNLSEAFSSATAVDPATECAGLLRTIIAATGMDISQLSKLLENDTYLTKIPAISLRLLNVEDE